jgi:acetyl esterase/lipase
MASAFAVGVRRQCRRDRALGLKLSLLVAAWSLGSSALAASSDNSLAGLTEGAQIVRLYPGPAPGSEGATQTEVVVARRIYNVTAPTLTIFRPKAGAATGAVVIIAPGGGFQRLAINGEGYAAAKYLAERGITGIVLKYRTDATPEDRIQQSAAVADGAQGADRARTPGPANAPAAAPRPAPNTSIGAHQAVADGLAAVRYVRSHAADLNISAGQVGFLGFSAGAFVAMELAVSRDADSRPDFVGAIYSPRPVDMVVPADAPPLFLAVAADDEAVHAAPSLRIFQDWQAAGRPAELHLFESGKHGFNMSRQQKDSDHWIDEFLWWLRAPRGAVKLPEPPTPPANP